VTHAPELENELIRSGEEMREKPVVRYVAEYDAKRRGSACVVADVTPFPRMLRLLLGDVVQEFHAVLDHLGGRWCTTEAGLDS
jgi:hypothetical protein